MSCTQLVRFSAIIVSLGLYITAAGQQYERDFTNHIQQLIGGEREVVVEGGRIDLLNDSVAYEVEWAPNWKEAVGQSLWYGLQTNRKPGIILLIRSQSEYKYLIQLNTALMYGGLDKKISVLAYPQDFSDLGGSH